MTEEKNIIRIPKNVQFILDTLMNHGYEAYVVGGCVRDAILGKKPSDWDITTSAKPTDIKKIFYKTIDTGIEHGTVTVMLDHIGYEVTTYRIDGEYKDGRHPTSVEFTGNLIEDLKRRDFTINAMAYNHIHGIVDAFDGIKDIHQKLIKCVGNPTDRFNEDALRILRAIRFAAGLDFEIEVETKHAIKKLAKNLNKISRERIRAELEKLMMSNHPEKIYITYETGVSYFILPELDRIINEGNGDEVIDLVTNIEKNHYLRWAALLSMSDRQNCVEILRGLRFDNKTVDIVSRIVESCKKDIPTSYAQIRKSIYEVGEDIYDYYIRFMKYFTKYSLSGKNANYKQIKIWKKRYHKILYNNDCISMKMLAVNGRDLIALGVPRGSQVGEELNRILYMVLDNPKLNDRGQLINIFKNERSYNNISEENQQRQ